MGDFEPQLSRDTLIDNLALQVPIHREFFAPSDQRYFLTLEGIDTGRHRVEKYKGRVSMIARMKTPDRKLWDMVLSESVSQAADVASGIGAKRPDLLALLFVGSNRVGLGDFHKPELDFRLVTEDEPWDVIDMFRDEYGKRSKATNLRNWQERLALKLGDPLIFTPADDEKVGPLSRGDLILPADVLDIGYNPENGILAPVTSDGGAFSRKALDKFVLIPNRQQTVKRRRGFDQGTFQMLQMMGDLARNELAYSTPVWLKNGEEDYIKSIISRARQLEIPSERSEHTTVI